MSRMKTGRLQPARTQHDPVPGGHSRSQRTQHWTPLDCTRTGMVKVSIGLMAIIQRPKRPKRTHKTCNEDRLHIHNSHEGSHRLYLMPVSLPEQCITTPTGSLLFGVPCLRPSWRIVSLSKVCPPAPNKVNTGFASCAIRSLDALVDNCPIIYRCLTAASPGRLVRIQLKGRLQRKAERVATYGMPGGVIIHPLHPTTDHIEADCRPGIRGEE